jgi:hypothetical protein
VKSAPDQLRSRAVYEPLKPFPEFK